MLQKKDFVEIDFTGRIKNGEVFDSTVMEELEKLHHNHSHPIEAKPFIFCIGQGMFLESIDDFLIGKETGKIYDLELTPEKAFGNRNPDLVQMIPMKIFQEQKINPMPGASLNFDGRMGKILTVSGGRVMVDFNHVLAGKTVDYKINVLRVLSDLNEKIKALNEFFFRRDFNFKVEEKKLVIEADKQFAKVVSLFGDKFREIIDLDLEVKEIETKGNERKNEEEAKKEQ